MTLDDVLGRWNRPSCWCSTVVRIHLNLGACLQVTPMPWGDCLKDRACGPGADGHQGRASGAAETVPIMVATWPDAAKPRA